MTTLIATNTLTVILGLGVTGLSVARYLTKMNRLFVVVDTRPNPPAKTELLALSPDIKVYAGELTSEVSELLSSADEIVISPGLPRELPVVQEAIKAGVSVIGDIELFLRDAKAPVVGITGSNGKTTVTTLVGLAAECAGLNAPVAGNIGVPALDVLSDDAQLYILELSSFQLESITKGGLKVGCILNVSEDHMDRYPSLAAYCMAKQRIYWGANHVVYNLNDPLTQPPVAKDVSRSGFGLAQKAEKQESQYYWNRERSMLELENKKPSTEKLTSEELFAVADLKIAGQHNIANALAVYAICDAAGIARSATMQALKKFTGLPHRCQWVAEVNDVTFINDSKATNVGAAVAAITGLRDSFASMTLIVGGDGKGADFESFGEVINENVSRLVLIGRDAEHISKHVGEHVEKIHAGSMTDAVNLASSVTPAGGVVLLSPACASFDMFSGYEQRGARFASAVGALNRD